MKVGKACKRDLVVAYESESVIEVSKRMRERNVGAVIVVGDEGNKRVPVGILTDRDIVVGVVAKTPELLAVIEVGDVMRPDPIVAHEAEDIGDVLKKMQRHGIRRIPVVGAKNALIGIFTLDDALDLLLRQAVDLRELVVCQPRASELRDLEVEERNVLYVTHAETVGIRR